MVRSRSNHKRGDNMNRRKLLKQAAVTSVALGSLPLAGGEALADDGKREQYHFLVLSRHAGAAAPEGVITSGEGAFGAGEVSGGGGVDDCSGDARAQADVRRLDTG